MPESRRRIDDAHATVAASASPTNDSAEHRDPDLEAERQQK